MTTGPLLQTKLYAPRVTRGLVDRPRLRERLSARPSVLVVSAPAGFGKSTLLAQALLGAVPRGTGDGGVAVPGRRRQRPVVVLGLRARSTAYGGAGRGCLRAGPPGVTGRRPDHDCPDQPHQRPGHVRGGGRPRPRRLPRHHGARDPRGDDVPRRPPADAAAPRHRDAVGPAAAPRAVARPRRAGRGARRRPAVHGAGDRGVLRRNGAAAVGRRGQHPGGEDRGLGRRTAAGGPVVAGQGGRRRVHRRVRGRRPSRRRLPRRGGRAPPARGRPPTSSSRPPCCPGCRGR